MEILDFSDNKSGYASKDCFCVEEEDTREGTETVEKSTADDYNISPSRPKLPCFSWFLVVLHHFIYLFIFYFLYRCT